MNWVKKTTLLTLLFFATALSLIAQSELRKAKKLLELQSFEEAIPKLKKIVNDDPNNQEAQIALGEAYWLTRDLDNARELFESAGSLGVLPSKTYKTYGNTLMALKAYPEALEQFSLYGVDYPAEAELLIGKCAFALEHEQDLPEFEVTEEYINTTKRDFNPTFFGDDVVYLSNRTDMNGPKSKLDNTHVSIELLRTEKDAKGLLKFPKRIKSLTGKQEFNIISLAYNPVLEIVAVTRAPRFDNIQLTAEDKCTLYIGRFDKYGAIENLKPYEFNQTDYSTGFASFSEDGMTMYFASDRVGGEGGFDIYASQLVGGKWSAPIHLGKEVNTLGNEITPLAIGDLLFFASDNHPGFGGFDVFKAVDHDDQFVNVSNLGPNLNTSFDEYGMVYNPILNQGYITSNRSEGKGLEDIYRIRALHDFNFEEVVTLPKADASRTEDLPYEILKGMTIDQVSKEPVKGVEVLAQAEDENTIISAKTSSKGTFSIPLVAGKYYTLKFETPGYLQSSRTLLTERTKAMPLMRVEMISNQIVASKTDSPIAKPVGLGKSLPDYKREEKSLAPEKESIKSEEALKVVVKSKEKIIEPLSTKKEFKAPALTKAYAIQLAAVSNNTSTHMFANVKDLGSLYTLFDSKVYKVRCGLYSTRKEAEEALRRAKVRGYESAFIVEEKPSDHMDLVMMDFTVQEPKPMNNKKRQAIQSFSAAAINTAVSAYKVRLATYNNSKWFDGSKVEGDGFGYVEIIMNEKGQSIYLLAGFVNREAASQARDRAIEKGFLDAYLVEDLNGVLKKID